VRWPRRTIAVPKAVDDGSIAIVHCAEAFVFAPGHRMRAAHCLICHALIGNRHASIIGAAALAGDACECGGVVSDLFVIHAGHMPIDRTVLRDAITRGLRCDARHS
jgi:hypothetical protein